MQVAACIASAEVAQKEWAKSRFGQRKRLLRIFTKHMLEHAESICRCAATDADVDIRAVLHVICFCKCRLHWRHTCVRASSSLRSAHLKARLLDVLGSRLNSKICGIDAYRSAYDVAPPCSVAVRDSGKPMVDAAFGELVVTCEKALWLVDHGEQYLKPERRRPGRMVRSLLT